MKPQYARVLEAAKAGSELQASLDVFQQALTGATVISATDGTWTRMDSVVAGDLEIFKSVVLGHVHDRSFARDSYGSIYVTKDHAHDLLRWRIEAVEKRLGVVRSWATILGAFLVLALCARCLS